MKKPRLNKQEESRLKKHLEKMDYDKLYLIFSEGSKTEPYYFEGFKREIEAQTNSRILIEIIGVGKATTQLLKFAEEFIEEFEIANGEIWLVSDKDDFPPDQFNEMIRQCDKRNTMKYKNNYWHAAWSNECFELWFILHFCFYQPACSRKEYYRLLKEQFKKRKIGTYEKNDKDIFYKLVKYGNPKSAIFYAKKLYQEKKGLLYSKAVPCTSVFILVEELAKYLPRPLKEKFL